MAQLRTPVRTTRARSGLSAASEAQLFGIEQPAATGRLLIAALEAFAELGFHGTTTRDIARRAKVSAAGLYTHYSSKDALLERIITVTHEAMLAEMRAVFARPADPTERLRALVHVHARFHATYHIAARVANYELHSLMPKTRAEVLVLRQEITAVMREALRLGVVAAEFAVADEALMTTSILSLGIDVSRWFSRRSTLTPDDIGEHCSLLVLRMVGAADPRPRRRQVAAVRGPRLVPAARKPRATVDGR